MQTTISSKYQVVIPKPVRDHLQLKPKQKTTAIEKDKKALLAGGYMKKSQTIPFDDKLALAAADISLHEN